MILNKFNYGEAIKPLLFNNFIIILAKSQLKKETKLIWMDFYKKIKNDIIKLEDF